MIEAQRLNYTENKSHFALQEVFCATKKQNHFCSNYLHKIKPFAIASDAL